MLTPKTLNAQLSVYFLKESLNLIVCQRYVFFSVLAAIIRKSSGKQLALRCVKALPFIHQLDRVAPKASDVSAADWLYQHIEKKTILDLNLILKLCLFLFLSYCQRNLQ